jgi:hypothetical protein
MDFKEAKNKIDKLAKLFKTNLLFKTLIFKIIEEINHDGDHSFDELYDHRLALTIELTRHIGGIRSIFHEDGGFIKDCFVIRFTPSSGKQCSYHYKLKYWDMFEHCETQEYSEKWDGHNSFDVIERLKNK